MFYQWFETSGTGGVDLAVQSWDSITINGVAAVLMVDMSGKADAAIARARYEVSMSVHLENNPPGISPLSAAWWTGQVPMFALEAYYGGAGTPPPLSQMFQQKTHYLASEKLSGPPPSVQLGGHESFRVSGDAMGITWNAKGDVESFRAPVGGVSASARGLFAITTHRQLSQYVPPDEASVIEYTYHVKLLYKSATHF